MMFKRCLLFLVFLLLTLSCVNAADNITDEGIVVQDDCSYIGKI